MSESFYTKEQKRVMRYQGLAKVFYHKNMYKRNNELGYAKPSKPYNEIHIASDVPEDAKRVVLLHEIGHVYFNHTGVNVKNELKDIKKIFEREGMDFKKGIARFGGPMTFLNYCMDLEVNSKLLTLANVKTMYDNGFKILTQKSMDVPTLDGFRDYYEVLILKLKEQEEKEKKNPKIISLGGENNDDGEGDGDSDDDEDSSDGTGSGAPSPAGNKKKSKNSNGNSSKGNDSDEDGDDDSDEGVDEDSFKKNGAKEEPADFSDFLDPSMRDISSDVDPYDSDLDDEMSDALKDENYKRVDDETPQTEKSVNDSLDSVEDGEEVDSNVNPCAGTSGDIDKKVELVSNTDKEISKFFTSILHFDYNTTLNYVKHYNRGTRRNPSGLLYSSVTNNVQSRKTRLGVLIDVSGSMETESILKACSSLKGVSRSLDSQSIGVTWNVRMVQEFSLFNVPEYVDVGGGTNMARGLEYLVNEKKCDTVVIYSDFCTDGMEDMIEFTKKKGIKLYSIDVATSRILSDGTATLPYGINEDTWNSYLKANKKFIRVI